MYKEGRREGKGVEDSILLEIRISGEGTSIYIFIKREKGKRGRDISDGYSKDNKEGKYVKWSLINVEKLTSI